MKFITITILFALIAYSSLNKIPLEDRWCGSSVVGVAISSTENGKESITKAKLTVPVSLEKSVSHLSVDAKSKQENFNTGSLIKKSQQGIVFTLDGPADSTQLGKIFEKDEDSENDIYIPYIFLTDIIGAVSPQVNPTNFSIDLFFKKDFKTKIYANNQLNKVTIKFLADSHNTHICECMFAYFLAKIKYNWSLRQESLKYIRMQLFMQIRNLNANYKAVKTIKGTQADLTMVETLKKKKIIQETECSNIKLSLDYQERSVIEVSKKMDSLNNPNCEKFDAQISEIRQQLDVAMSSASANVNAAALNLRMSVVELGISNVNAQVNEQRKYTDDLFKAMEDNAKELETVEAAKYNAKRAEFTNLKLEADNLPVDSQIKFFENASTQVGNIKTYFDGSFWKTTQ